MFRILTMIVGLDNFASSVGIEPDDTIATLLDKVQRNLISLGMPHQYTGAYSIVHTREEGLTEDDPDNIALERSDPDVMAKYLTPAARLDPTKTVRHYFGESVTPCTASVVLTWPPESLAFMEQVRERTRIATDAYFAKLDAERSASPGTDSTAFVGAVESLNMEPDAAPVAEETERSGSKASASAWEWLASPLSWWAWAGCSTGVRRSDDPAKKND